MSPVLGRGRVIVVCRWNDREPDLAARLRTAYLPWFGPTAKVVVRRLPGLRVAVAVVSATDDLVEVPSVFAWGTAVGAAGLASTSELAAAVQEPRRAGELLGSFVVVQVEQEAVRLLVSADLVHALKHVQGTDGEAWSSHGLAAAVAAGRALAVRPEHVPELVLSDYVWGDEELLDGVSVLREAHLVEIRAGEVTTREWWTTRDRLLARDDVDARELRETCCGVLERLDRVGDLELALTAGRDSTLLASCFAELGLRPATFTFGLPGQPDPAGAQAVAAHLGWSHRVVGPEPERQTSVERMLRTTRWTEGLETAWNSIGTPLRWEQPRPFQLYGIAGEMGRAFYWGKVDDLALLDDPARLMLRGLCEDLAPATAEVLRSRADGFVAELRGRGWTGTGVLDAWHAQGRVRKWPMRTPAPPGVEALLTAYPSPPLARALLGIPASGRRRAEVFDEAARLGGDLHALAASAPLPPAPRTRRRWPGRRDVSVVLAARARRELALTGSPVDEVMGQAWRRRIDTSTGHAAHRWRWGAIAVDALAADLRQLSTDPVLRAWQVPDGAEAHA